MYRPSYHEFDQLCAEGNLIPVYRELPADLETPVSVYMKLQDEGPSFLLESIAGGKDVARYSFIGVRPRSIFSVMDHHVMISGGGLEKEISIDRKNPLDILRKEIQASVPVNIPQLPRFIGGAVGYLGYDSVRRFERLPDTADDDLKLPESVFMQMDNIVAFDHARQRLLIIVNARIEGDNHSAYQRALARIDEIAARLQAPIPSHLNRFSSTDEKLKQDKNIEHESNFTREEFKHLVKKAKEYIAAGDIFQVVLSQRLSGETTAYPFDIYRTLRRLNPSPYMVFLRFPGGLGRPPLHVIAASPEMHVRLEDGVAEVRPIAGTRPRGNTPSDDAALAEELLADEKERAEHLMLVDLARNDLGRVCNYGSVKVEDMMVVEKYSHVMHIVSSVRGYLMEGKDAFDLLKATFPAGTVSGAPKVRAMEIVEELEGTRRNLYAGAIAYVGYDGNMDSCITIRTIVMKGNHYYIQSGAGIVADSDPDSEYEETLRKARATSEAVFETESEVRDDFSDR